ncbi:MAG: head GIN domain-containing protein, partial [Flammeovirgaceae bacterium]
MNGKFFQFAFIFLCVMGFAAYGQHSETRNVGNFTEIKIGGAYDVYIKKGSSVAVRLEGPDKDVSKVVTEVENGVLKVHKQKKSGWGNWSSSRSVKVYITFTTLEGLYSSGSSDILVESEIQADQFRVKCSGSGDMEVPMRVNALDASVSGSGDMQLKGSSGALNFRVSGSGDIDASNLKAKQADLKISGSGSMRVHVTDQLNARISGSGRVRYKGNPKQSV